MRTCLIVATLLAEALAAPRVVRPGGDVIHRRQEGSDEEPPVWAILDTPTEVPAGPTNAKGSLRGPTGLAGYSPSNPVNTELPAYIPADQVQLVTNQEADTDLGLYLDLTEVDTPQPIRGGGTKAPTDPGPRNIEVEKQNSDVYAPPGTDSGDVPNAKWPLALSHNRHGKDSAGWARQQNVNQLPIATQMAGVDMHLEPNAYRELHW